MSTNQKASRISDFLNGIANAIFDKRLYGTNFFLLSGPFLGLGFGIEITIISQIRPEMLLLYFPIFIVVVLMTGLESKNFTREVNNIGRVRGVLFLLASVIAVITPFLIGTQNDFYGLFRFSITFLISTVALIFAIFEITIYGQRASLRSSLQLTKGFIKDKKEAWKGQLENFPNSEKIINNIDECQFILGLFDRGAFDLTILWVCNIMEKVIDTATDQIISKDPEKAILFRREDNHRLSYPKQLQNLGFNPNLSNQRKDEQKTLEELWHEIRNRIAHHNVKPTFQETAGAINLFISFMNEIPQVLLSWNVSD